MSKQFAELRNLVAREDVALGRRIRDLTRRLMNEGMGPFLGSMFFLTIGCGLLTLYYTSAARWDNAITDEILTVLGSPQEPADVREMGLVAAALSKVDAVRPDAGVQDDPSECEVQGPNCTAFDRLHSVFAMRLAKLPSSELTTTTVLGIANDKTYDVPERFRYVPRLNQKIDRLEADNGYECYKGASAIAGKRDVFVLIPAQTRDDKRGTRAEVAGKQAEALAESLNEVTFPNDAGSNRVVQIYFITTDSALRIWSLSPNDICKEFSPTLLWASKNYFNYFWSHPNGRLITHTYIDYGGNGLVRTICRDIGKSLNQATGPLLGVLCADLKIRSEDYSIALHRHLLLETADVRIPLPFSADSIKVTMASGFSQGRAAAAVPSEYAYSMLGKNSVDEKEVADAIGRSVKDPSVLKREITRVTLPDAKGAGFLLPIGVSNNPPAVNAIFFRPRNPRLPIWPYRAYAMVGFASLGTFLCSLVYGRRFRNQATNLRHRQSLLRNLQVGVVQVDSEDWVLECNDRAEELFGIQLPKVGTDRLPIKFKELLDKRVERIDASSAPQDEECPFRPIDIEYIDELRSQSKASSYYARLKRERGDSREHKWLLISATPVMLGRHRKRRERDEVMLSNVFATVVAASPETNQLLNRWFEDGRSREAHA